MARYKPYIFFFSKIFYFICRHLPPDNSHGSYISKFYSLRLWFIPLFSYTYKSFWYRKVHDFIHVIPMRQKGLANLHHLLPQRWEATRPSSVFSGPMLSLQNLLFPYFIIEIWNNTKLFIFQSKFWYYK